MKIAYLAAGAGGMYCGNCLRDNALAAALIRAGHQCLLIPTYTPIRTDEHDVSLHRVFFGGINVYLQQHSALFRRTPWLLDRLLDFPGLLRWVARFGNMTEAHGLGELTVSMLMGRDGRQKKEVDKLLAWLKREVKPDIVHLPNAMFVGIAATLKRELGVPVVATLCGEDIFLDALNDGHRTRCLELISQGIADCDALTTVSRYFADFSADYFRSPRERINVVPVGVNLKGYDAPRPSEARPPTVGFLARICPAKGLHVLAEAFRRLRSMEGTRDARLRIAGYLGESDRPYFDDLRTKAKHWGLADAVEFAGEVNHAEKIRFLQTVDVFSVPSVYREPKGQPVIEALAAGTPVVQPASGAYPELLADTGGGMLVRPDDAADLANGLHRLLVDGELRNELGHAGREAVFARHTDAMMADRTLAVYRRLAQG